ncbi:MAG TPA: hypothetical protein VMR25_23915 [Planctomycetaceae bacterium]|jgi:hypothetical protein|nr:hypothetical protein [Planctomycetaceae bacterium]
MSNDTSISQANDEQYDRSGTLTRMKSVARVAFIVVLLSFVAIRAGGFLHIIAELWHKYVGF